MAAGSTSKVKVYIRVGKSMKGNTRGRTYVEASRTPSREALYNSKEALATVAFAVDLDIPDRLFTQAEEVIAELRITSSKQTIAAEVKAV